MHARGAARARASSRRSTAGSASAGSDVRRRSRSTARGAPASCRPAMPQLAAAAASRPAVRFRFPDAGPLSSAGKSSIRRTNYRKDAIVKCPRAGGPLIEEDTCGEPDGQPERRIEPWPTPKSGFNSSGINFAPLIVFGLRLCAGERAPTDAGGAARKAALRAARTLPQRLPGAGTGGGPNPIAGAQGACKGGAKQRAGADAPARGMKDISATGLPGSVPGPIVLSAPPQWTCLPLL